jgi:hypothetical protein
MSATNAFETALLTLYFNNTDHANIGDAAGIQNSATAGSFYVSLHTADPGETGNQTTSESAYTNYARVAVARSAAGWTISNANVSNAAIISFPAGGATGSLVTHFGIGSDSSGAGNLFFRGALTSSLQVNSGITPSFAIGELDVNID